MPHDQDLEYARVAVTFSFANSTGIIEETQVRQKTYKSMWCYSEQVAAYFARADKRDN